jgi:hypothetical protein
MKGKASFTAAELDELRRLLREKATADRDRQKTLRQRMRDMEFYISDFSGDQQGFTAFDLDVLIRRGTVTVVGTPTSSATVRTAPPVTTRPRGAAPAVPTLAEDHGHRVTVDWMGHRVETLADLMRPGLRAVCVGINPSPVSVAAGHYYQARLGQAFFRDSGRPVCSPLARRGGGRHRL